MERIAARSVVLPLPLELPDHLACAGGDEPPGPGRAAGPLVLWNHRWEHDKGPEAFFAALRRLVERDVPFRVAICGERFREAPACFADAPGWLGSRLIQLGRLESRDEYFALLGRCQLAVSTAVHEFFGIAMLEAVHLGARPLVPDRLAYRELFPAELRYARDEDLAGELERLCRGWTAGELNLRADRRALAAPYRAAVMLPRYAGLIGEVVGRGS
jgi:glycosyltransferase involved in cell wall biosynthesis